MQRKKEQQLFKERLKTLEIEKELELKKQQIQAEQIAKEMEIQTAQLKILKSTMHTVHDIVGNFLTNIQLFQLEIEQTKTLSPKSTKQLEALIFETAARLKKLADIEVIIEKEVGTGIFCVDYEQSTD